jgi:hypothetical protein
VPAVHSMGPTVTHVHSHGGSVHTVRTSLRADSAGMVLSSCGGPSLRVAGAGIGDAPYWPADALLVGAVDAGVRADFMHRAELHRLAVAFYESTAQGRWVEGAGGPELLDLVVDPRVGVHNGADAALAKSLFHEVAAGCLVAHALRAPLTLQPTVEIWSAPPATPGGAVPA